MATESNLLAQIVDLKRKLVVIEGERERLQRRLWASIESLADENLKYGTLVDPRTPVLKGVTKGWRKILECLVEMKHFRARDVIFASRRLYKDNQIPREQTSGSARFQLAALEKRGVLKRIGGGNYRLSDRARAEIFSTSQDMPELEPPTFDSVPAGDAR